MKNFTQAYMHSLELLKWRGDVVMPRNIECRELLAHTFNFSDCRKRIIFHPERKSNPFYMAGELLWYFLGSNELDFISYYSKVWNNCSDDGKTLNSAYGRRIFKGENYLTIQFNQYKKVVEQLKADPHTRQAIIHLHTPNKIQSKDEVCTLCLQFFIRDNKLVQHVTMRSNDCIWGTTYDVYFFTILQEIMADELGVECGAYYHTAGSFHIYKKDYAICDKLLSTNYSNEGLYDTYLSKVHYDKNFMHDLHLLKNVEEYYRLTNIDSPVKYGKLIGIGGCTSYVGQEIIMLLALYACYKYFKKYEPSKLKKSMLQSLENLEPYICKPTMWLLDHVGEKLWM